MRQVRRMTFETNSSSTHSLTICPQETYDKWLSGKALFSDWKENFIEVGDLTPRDYEEAGIKYESYKRKYYKSWNELSAEEKKEYTTEYVLTDKKNKDSDEYLTYDEWFDRHNHGTETFESHYKTPSGDNIVVFGYYGYE